MIFVPCNFVNVASPPGPTQQTMYRKENRISFVDWITGNFLFTVQEIKPILKQEEFLYWADIDIYAKGLECKLKGNTVRSFYRIRYQTSPSILVVQNGFISIVIMHPPRGLKGRGVADAQRGSALVFLGKFSIFCIPVSTVNFICILRHYFVNICSFSLGLW